MQQRPTGSLLPDRKAGRGRNAHDVLQTGALERAGSGDQLEASQRAASALCPVAGRTGARSVDTSELTVSRVTAPGRMTVALAGDSVRGSAREESGAAPTRPAIDRAAPDANAESSRPTRQRLPVCSGKHSAAADGRVSSTVSHVHAGLQAEKRQCRRRRPTAPSHPQDGDATGATKLPLLGVPGSRSGKRRDSYSAHRRRRRPRPHSRRC